MRLTAAWGAAQCLKSTRFCCSRATCERAPRKFLAKAEITQDPDARQKMREVAAAYERLAQRLEYEAGGTGK
jgi:hypothetical protein